MIHQHQREKVVHDRRRVFSLSIFGGYITNGAVCHDLAHIRSQLLHNVKGLFCSHFRNFHCVLLYSKKVRGGESPLFSGRRVRRVEEHDLEGRVALVGQVGLMGLELHGKRTLALVREGERRAGQVQGIFQVDEHHAL